MAVNKTKKIDKIIKNIGDPPEEKRYKPPNGLTKKILWQMFVDEFREMNAHDFIQNEMSLSNLKTLFWYFLKDERFFLCDNLKNHLSVPKFEKGLLIIGGYGIGKTAILKVFENLFKGISEMRFKRYGSKELVEMYENCGNSNDKREFFFKMERKKLLIDDINAERISSNFGKVEIIEEVLMKRCENKLETYVTCNYSNSQQNIEKTLEDLGRRYGPRLHDRIFEMFNIVEFVGKSYRR